MHKLAKVPAESPRGQCIVLLLSALKELGCSRTKYETVSFIRNQHWFDIQKDDLHPYPSVTTKEPRWQTQIAFAMKDARDAELTFSEGLDQWAISRRGVEELREVESLYRTGALVVGNCFFWTLKFKTRLNPSYTPSQKDAIRPYDLYKDINNSVELIAPKTRDLKKRIAFAKFEELLRNL
jgi:hypothetical protein